MDFSGSLSGIKDIDKVFTNLPRSSQRKVYMRALREGAKPVKDAATNNIRQVSKKFTGLLSRKSTVAVYNYKKYRGNFRVAVQIRRGLLNNLVEGEPVRVGLYASVLEYGKNGQPPRSWIRKAIRENKEQAVNALASEFNKRLTDAVKDAKR